MNRTQTRFTAPVLSLVLATFALACSHSEPEPLPSPTATRETAPGELPQGATALTPAEGEITPGGIVRDPAARPARAGTEGLLVSEADGVALEALPPAVLADVRAQLLAAGASEQVAQLDRQYDATTGKARNAAVVRGLVVETPSMRNAGGAR
jgi:hypothetical protein